MGSPRRAPRTPRERARADDVPLAHLSVDRDGTVTQHVAFGGAARWRLDVAVSRLALRLPPEAVVAAAHAVEVELHRQRYARLGVARFTLPRSVGPRP